MASKHFWKRFPVGYLRLKWSSSVQVLTCCSCRIDFRVSSVLACLVNQSSSHRVFKADHLLGISVVMSHLDTSGWRQFLFSDSSVAFWAGGMAGAVSRTVVSPFERVKILLQVQSSTQAYNQGVFGAVKQIYVEEGIPGLLRGNGLNCVRIFPYSAVQFVVYDFCKRQWFQLDATATANQSRNHNQQLHGWQRLVGGATCGFCSVLATYPLDLIRTRLSIQTANLARLKSSSAKPPGVWELLVKTYVQEGGIAGLYRGFWPTSIGVVPYVALNFTVYEQLREFIPSSVDPTWASLYKLSIGAISGGVAQTITYPFDLLRRRFQVLAMGQNALGYRYTGVLDALRTIGRTEGFKGYYKGLTANLFKVVPSTAVSWVVYEAIRDVMAKS
ncbi:LANO_0F04786g1_1 [Lachancea nothofagi CBS 11611]|uniref:LANO_0F04786g1_1 n=1 Tax=Lachancea nothofagi CBS 11611 TaxID=1266666 RepID=A0A1G4K7T2_9SACH|nr:LANO_0F04786g1_1 [Lachancea nothofagi CBS 11611]